MKDYWLIVVTDSYSGNFERELSSFAFGVSDEYSSKSSDWLNLNVDSSSQDLYDFWSDTVEHFPTEYGYMPCEICQDPTSKESFYNSIKFKINSEAWNEIQENPEFINFLKNRLVEGCKRLNGQVNFVKLLSVVETRNQDVKEI